MIQIYVYHMLWICFMAKAENYCSKVVICDQRVQPQLVQGKGCICWGLQLNEFSHLQCTGIKTTAIPRHWKGIFLPFSRILQFCALILPPAGMIKNWKELTRFPCEFCRKHKIVSNYFDKVAHVFVRKVNAFS